MLNKTQTKHICCKTKGFRTYKLAHEINSDVKSLKRCLSFTMGKKHSCCFRLAYEMYKTSFPSVAVTYYYDICCVSNCKLKFRPALALIQPKTHLRRCRRNVERF